MYKKKYKQAEEFKEDKKGIEERLQSPSRAQVVASNFTPHCGLSIWCMRFILLS